MCLFSIYLIQLHNRNFKYVNTTKVANVNLIPSSLTHVDTNNRNQ